MPISIDDRDKANAELAWLCDEIWQLPEEIEALSSWCPSNRAGLRLPKGDHVADVGFVLRRDAMGGGAVLTAETMTPLGALGVTLYLSDYPGE